jgi:hypothetical protein
VGLTVTAVPPDFSISASPASQSVVAGSGTSYTVSTAVTAGSAGTVSLSVSGLPTGASASFNPTSVTAGGSSTLTVTTAATTAPGTYTLTVTGVEGGATHATTVGLTVTAPPDFTLAASPNRQTVSQNASTSYAISTGGAGTISLSVSGLPAGATASFNPASVTAGGGSTLTVTTAGTTPVGMSTLTITGVAGAARHSVTVNLKVSRH